MKKEKWQVSIPIEGVHDFWFETLTIDGVTFERVQFPNGMKLVASAFVELEIKKVGGTLPDDHYSPSTRTAINFGFAIIDKAATKLSYASGYPLRPLSEYYVMLLEPKMETPEKQSEFNSHITDGTAYSFDKPEVIRSVIEKLSNLRPEKRDTLDKILALYREARDIKNPLIAMILYFSCVSAILRDTSTREIPGAELRQALVAPAKLSGFTEDKARKIIKDMYSDQEGRCGVDHGRININDASMIVNATFKLHWLQSWTRSLIAQYIEENKP